MRSPSRHTLGQHTKHSRDFEPLRRIEPLLEHALSIEAYKTPPRVGARQHPKMTAALQRVDAHIIRYNRLVALLRDEAKVEPKTRPGDSADWLAWAHGTRWLLVGHLPLRRPVVRLTAVRAQRSLFESFAIVEASRPGSLVSPYSHSEIRTVVGYLDDVFAANNLIAVAGTPYAPMAWDPDFVPSPEEMEGVEAPPRPRRVLYDPRLTFLDDFRAYPKTLDELFSAMSTLATTSASTGHTLTSKVDELARKLDQFFAPVLTVRSGSSSNPIVVDDEVSQVQANGPFAGVRTGGVGRAGSRGGRGGRNGRSGNTFARCHSHAL